MKAKLGQVLFLVGIVALHYCGGVEGLGELTSRRLVMFFDAFEAESVTKADVKDSLAQSFALVLFQKGSVVCIIDQTVLHHFLVKKNIHNLFDKVHFQPADWHIFYVPDTRLYVLFPKDYDHIDGKNVDGKGISIFKETKWKECSGDVAALANFVKQRLKSVDANDQAYEPIRKIIPSEKD